MSMWDHERHGDRLKEYMAEMEKLLQRLSPPPSPPPPDPSAEEKRLAWERAVAVRLMEAALTSGGRPRAHTPVGSLPMNTQEIDGLLVSIRHLYQQTEPR